ncbi:MAG: AAA domain-containing protein [Candidatus Latescibacteria bacterium]|nr:AAA domain-containing protein [Candidatus Latescibacterota bacterium]
MPLAPPRPLPLNGTWRTYTPTDGLPGFRFEHIAEDGGGYLWFAGHESGAVRFDGDEFRTFTAEDGLSSNSVKSIHLDREGRLWFGTRAGLCWYDGRQFHPFEVANAPVGQAVMFLFEDREGRIWVGGQGHFGYIGGAHYCDLTPEYCRRFGRRLVENRDPCWGIAQDPSGTIWLGFEYLVGFDGSQVIQADLPPASHYYAVGQDAEGMVWGGSATEIWRWDGGDFQTQYRQQGHIRKIQHDREGRLWFCMGGKGALCYDGAAWHNFRAADGLGWDHVNGLLQDRGGHIWFATFGGGISCYDPHHIQLINIKTNHSEFQGALAEDRQGSIWHGQSGAGSGAVIRYCGRKHTVFSAEQGLALENCLAICEDAAGCLWLGGAEGLWRYDGTHFLQLGEKEGFAGEAVFSLALDRQGRILCGHLPNAQISRYDGQRFESLLNEKFGHLGYDSDLISVSTTVLKIIERKNGEIWFVAGPLSGGGAGVGQLTRAGDLRWYRQEDGLPSNTVWDLLEDRHGVLWLATTEGAASFDGTHFRRLTVRDGLSHNNVRCICEDNLGHLWFGTDNGVAHYDKQTIHTIRAPQIDQTTQIILDRNGAFWFNTRSGLVRYHLGQEPPLVSLERVIADRIYEDLDSVEISNTTRQISFEYKGRSFGTTSRDHLYTCRLEGYEDNWQAATRQRRVFYRDLPIGEYLFQVKAIDRDLNYSQPAQVRLQVIPDPHVAELTTALSTAGLSGQFIGESAGLRQVQTQLNQVAGTDMTVLILGETGTGKGIAARTLHQLSQREQAPFVAVNCGAIAENLVEAELFGHEKGAFTGAMSRRLGKVEVAEGGTLFLDEIGDMPLNAQVKLLQFLQERTFQRVGSSKILTADVRIVAATNRDLQEMIGAGTFREDLYFRLRIFPVVLPPLRQRRQDIPVLAYYFAERFAQHLDRPVPDISRPALNRLQAYDWPGNVRELEHLIQRAVLQCANKPIEERDITGGLDLPLGAAVLLRPGAEDGPFMPLAEHEKRYIEQALQATNWIIEGERGAAQLLNINPGTLRARIKKHGLHRPQ